MSITDFSPTTNTSASPKQITRLINYKNALGHERFNAACILLDLPSTDVTLLDLRQAARLIEIIKFTLYH